MAPGPRSSFRATSAIATSAVVALVGATAGAQTPGAVPPPPPASPGVVPAPPLATPPASGGAGAPAPGAQPPPPGYGPPPPGYAPSPPGYGPPPPGYGAPPPAAAPPPPQPTADARRPAELWLGLGFGNAVCDNTKPDSQCPVDGGFAGDLGGAWRFNPHWAVGGELAFWSFKVREAWKGQLTDPATDVKFSSFYFAPFVRWYWFDHGNVDGYLQGGIGLGSVTAEASNSADTYKVVNSGVVFPFGIGAEWHLSRLFRLGPQALAYLHDGTKVCESNSAVDNGAESCRDAGKDDRALPWRIMLVGTFMLGHR